MRIEAVWETAQPLTVGSAQRSEGGGFGEALRQAVQRVNGLQVQADVQAERLATGEAENVHDAVIALEKASLALELTIQVAKKAIEAYQEIHRIQV